MPSEHQESVNPEPVCPMFLYPFPKSPNPKPMDNQMSEVVQLEGGDTSCKQKGKLLLSNVRWNFEMLLKM